MTKLHIDIESRSEIDLIARGLDNYSSHPTTRILMLAWAIDDMEPELWLPHTGKPPADLRDAMRDKSVLLCAHNAQFEHTMLTRVLGAKIDRRRWRDTMIMAHYCGMPGKLGDLCEIVGMTDENAKMKDGYRLIRKFCIPRKPTKNKPWLFNDWTTDPEEWELFCTYCRFDVKAERDLMAKLAPFDLPPEEWEAWHLDQEINDRGMPVDRRFVENAIGMYQRAQKRGVRYLKHATGLANPMSTPQFLPWAKDRGYPFGDMRKNNVARVLLDEVMTTEGHEALKLRAEINKASVKKFDSILSGVGDDDRLRFTFQFMGASRTGRWAGRRTQLQNLPRPAKAFEDNLEQITDLIRANDFDNLEFETGDVMLALSSTVRSSFRAPDGHKLVVADLSAIEDRMVAWLARCETILREHREKLDPYKSFGTHLYKKPYEEITKTERTNSKPGRLGCFAEDTLVLTNNGWKPIVKVAATDLVHDGIEFVSHQGVVYQGEQTTINLAGVRVTPGHEVLTESGWKQAQQLKADGHLFLSAHNLASGLLRAARSGRAEAGVSASTSAGAPAETPFGSHEAILRQGNLHSASRAPEGITTTSAAPATHSSASPATTHSGWRSAFTRSGHAARAAQNATLIAGAAYAVCSAALSIFSRTSQLWRGGTTLRCLSTALTTTATTPRATCDSPAPLSKCPTRRSTGALSTTGSGTRERFFTACLRPAIAVRQLFSGKSERATRPRKSSPVKTSAVAGTEAVYDILNAGPRNRFVILTARGELIVHNCCYRLSAGELAKNKNGDIIKTGLWGYAESMGVKLTQQECAAAVTAYRSAYPEVVQFWYDLEQAAKDTLKTRRPQRVGHVTFDVKPPFLRARLPSGRYLHYLRPRLEVKEFVGKSDGRPYTKEVLSYEGVDQVTKKWGKIYTHGGKLCENLTQAAARDVLLTGLFNARAAGFEIVGHVHDEIITVVPDCSSLTHETLEACMARNPEWCKDLPLAAAGYTGVFYKKD